MAIAVLTTACADQPRYIVVDIDAPAGAPDVVQLRIDAVVGSDVGTLVAPKQPASTPLTWPRSFSLEVPSGAKGTAQLFVTAMDANGCEAMATSTEFSASTTRASITLAAVPIGAGVCLPAGTPIARSISSATAPSAASLPIAIPAGTAQDDVLIAFTTVQGGGNHSVKSPSDWMVVPNTAFLLGTTGTRTQAFWKVAGASEPASYLFTEGGTNPQDLNAMIIAVAGANTASPIEVSNGQTNPLGQSCPSPSLSTTTDHALLLYACAVEVGSGATSIPFTPPADMTQLAEIESAGSYRSGEETAWGAQSTAGVTPQFAATSSRSNVNVGLLVAIKGRTDP